MNRETLVREAEMAARNAKHNLRWIRRNPEKIDPTKRADMEAYLRAMIRFAREEKKNARRAGRTSLRTHLKELITIIITQNRRSVKSND
ncbi:hypothetical protein IJ21_17580 [Paenibacillus sp. 32O-W]|uniref:hypothetical protein n=1 Tax=Paenibacillus sp. 32O-W TaxID=1695218 RepID=UPI00071EEE4E|nr:hypothetical protein [Paenibacillus sp. 32O-W]ALS27159.1 hypothetical protein IJ21_17580 [Paenibacillus sp. 32O-W]